jgi:hypothetical protein
MDRVELIKKSLRCFVLGLLALLPILGLPMAVLALATIHSVTRRQGQEWNPAQQYLLWGRALAWWGGFVSLVLFTLILSAIINQ